MVRRPVLVIVMDHQTVLTLLAHQRQHYRHDYRFPFIIIREIQEVKAQAATAAMQAAIVDRFAVAMPMI